MGYTNMMLVMIAAVWLLVNESAMAGVTTNRRVAVTFDRWAMTPSIDPDLFRGEPETPPHTLRLTELREHSDEEETSE